MNVDQKVRTQSELRSQEREMNLAQVSNNILVSLFSKLPNDDCVENWTKEMSVLETQTQYMPTAEVIE